MLLDNSFENMNENFLILYFKYSHLAWLSLIFSSSHTCQLSRFCRETPGFYGNLQVSRFLSQKNILLLFQNNHANQVYLLYLLHTVKRGDFGQFFKVFSYFIFTHTFIAMVLPEKKNISPFAHSFPDQVYCYGHKTCCKIIEYRQVWKLFFGVTLDGQENLFLKYDLTSYYKVTCWL